MILWLNNKYQKYNRNINTADRWLMFQNCVNYDNWTLPANNSVRKNEIENDDRIFLKTAENVNFIPKFSIVRQSV